MRIAFAVLVLWTSAAFAGERFGDKGTIAPSGTVSLGRFSSGSNGTSGSLEPGAMVFLADGFAVGGSALLFYSTGNGFDFVSYGIAPSVGLNLWARERLSFFPQLSLQLIRSQVTTGGDLALTGLTWSLYVPALFHVTPHFFIGLGPSLTGTVASRATGSSPSGLILGLNTGLVLFNSVIGGWF